MLSLDHGYHVNGDFSDPMQLLLPPQVVWANALPPFCSPILDGTRHSQPPDGATGPTYRASNTKRPQRHHLRPTTIPFYAGPIVRPFKVGSAGRAVLSVHYRRRHCLGSGRRTLRGNSQCRKTSRISRPSSLVLPRRIVRRITCTVLHRNNIQVINMGKAFWKRCKCGMSRSVRCRSKRRRKHEEGRVEGQDQGRNRRVMWHFTHYMPSDIRQALVLPLWNNDNAAA
jgi:hypothetical protein